MRLLRKAPFALLSFVLIGFLFLSFANPAFSKPLELKCPEDPAVLKQKLREAYQRLIAVMGTGEGGKMDTPQKRKVYLVYKFYKDCYTSAGNISSGITPSLNPLLLSCQTGWKASHKILSVVTVVREAVPYESLKRVEISIRSGRSKEFFRAMINRFSKCAPIPPNAFGVYPIGEKETFTDRDIKDAGHEAATPVKTQYGNLVKGCKTVWHQGFLRIKWLISPRSWVTPDQSVTIYVKIVPADKKDATWISCGHCRCLGRNIKSDRTPSYGGREQSAQAEGGQ